MTKTTTVVGAIVAVSLLAAYVVVTISGHDASQILYVLIGWLGGSGTPAVAAAVKRQGP